MARGKNRNRSANRVQKAKEELSASLLAELAAEQALLGEAEAACVEVDALQSRIQAGQAELDQQTAPLLERLLVQRNRYRDAYADAKAHHDSIHAGWNKYMDLCVDLSAGKSGTERLESLFEVLGINAYLLSEIAGETKLSIEQATGLQRARGMRTDVATSTPTSRALTRVEEALEVDSLPLKAFDPLKDVGLWPEGSDKPLIPEDHTGLTMAQRKAIERLSVIAEKAIKSMPDSTSKEGIYNWGNSAFVPDGDLDSPVFQALGRVPDDTMLDEEMLIEHAEGPRPYDWRNHSKRSAEEFLKTKGPLFNSWKAASDALGVTTNSMTSIPIHSCPGRGIALQHAYTRSGLASWMHCTSTPNIYSQMTSRLAEASTYWLPAGQTAAFADSEPLDEADRNELTLPFQQVFLAFAEPLILPASRKKSAEEQMKFSTVSENVHFARKNDYDLSKTLGLMVRGDTLVNSLGELLPCTDARIEGVLLLADEDGSPQDHFAWCMAVPGEYGVTLGRYMIPASRKLSAYRDLIDNLNAVVAWAHWHEPDAETVVSEDMNQKQLREKVKSTDFLNSATNSGVNIRVVNVRTTSHKPGAKPSEKTSHREHEASKPHVRRGHWRRQRYGTGREQIKRIRIAPVLVNAHRADFELRVYRLPAVRIA